MDEDRQADGKVGRGGNVSRMREMGIFDDHCEHDRGEPRGPNQPMNATVAGRA